VTNTLAYFVAASVANKKVVALTSVGKTLLIQRSDIHVDPKPSIKVSKFICLFMFADWEVTEISFCSSSSEPLPLALTAKFPGNG
jgi:hypothetical protein